MLNFLPGKLIGCLSFSLYILNTIFWLMPILVFSLFKALIPLRFSKKVFSYLLDLMASNWVATNSAIQNVFTKTRIVVSGLDKLKIDDWYLVLAFKLIGLLSPKIGLCISRTKPE